MLGGAFMKYVIVFLLFPLYTLADGRFEGTWVWSGNQCRDANLSPESRRSVSKSRGGFDQVMSAKITMDAVDKASFEFQMRGEDKVTENGTYKVRGNRVTAGNETYHAGDHRRGGGFEADWVAGRLLVDAGEGYQIGCEEGDRDCEEIQLCNSGEKFVLVFGRVNQ